MMKVSYICLYNSTQLQELLMPSMDLLSKENRSFELILVNSKERGYKSAAEAFNKTLDEKWDSLGEIVCFVHQDIRFDDTRFHDRLVAELNKDPYQLLGAAGVREGEKTVSNLRYFDNAEFITSMQILNEEKYVVDSLDECCFATTKKLLSMVRFDEMRCFHWHLYAVDLCYMAKIQFGYPSFVLPESIYHKFNDKTGLYRDKYFLQTMLKLQKKYYHKSRFICAPCYYKLSTGILGRLRVLITYIHHLYFL